MQKRKKQKKTKKKQKTFTVKKSVKTKTGEKLRSQRSVLPGCKAFIYHIVKTLTKKALEMNEETQMLCG